MLSGAATMIYMRIDQVMLGNLATDKAVGIYSAAVKLSECWYFVPAVIATSFFPAIVSMKVRDNSKYYAQLQSLLRFVAAISYFIVFFLIAFSKPLVLALFGEVYPDFAAIGASIATFISYAFSFYISNFLFPSTRKITLMMSKAMLLRC